MKLENILSVSSNRVSILSSFIAFALLISGCSLCQEQKISELESPNGKLVAALYMRDCGATGAPVYHINLREKGASVSHSPEGKIDDGAVFYKARRGAYGDNIKLMWKDATNLLIECANCTADQPVHVENKWQDIIISYQAGVSSQ